MLSIEIILPRAESLLLLSLSTDRRAVITASESRLSLLKVKTAFMRKLFFSSSSSKGRSTETISCESWPILLRAEATLTRTKLLSPLSSSRGSRARITFSEFWPMLSMLPRARAATARTKSFWCSSRGSRVGIASSDLRPNLLKVKTAFLRIKSSSPSSRGNRAGIITFKSPSSSFRTRAALRRTRASSSSSMAWISLIASSLVAKAAKYLGNRSLFLSLRFSLNNSSAR